MTTDMNDRAQAWSKLHARAQRAVLSRQGLLASAPSLPTLDAAGDLLTPELHELADRVRSLVAEYNAQIRGQVQEALDQAKAEDERTAQEVFGISQFPAQVTLPSEDGGSLTFTVQGLSGLRHDDSGFSGFAAVRGGSERFFTKNGQLYWASPDLY